MISITKKFKFEAAHAIVNYNGPCKNIHGHSYQLEVSITGIINKETCQILDFKIIKEIVSKLIIEPIDHSLIIKESEIKKLWLKNYKGKIFLLEAEPTAESLIIKIADILQKSFPDGIALKQLKLHETNSCSVDWEK